MTAVEERRLKNLVKDAVVEVLQERHDLLREALQASLEDVAMWRAIQDGKPGSQVGERSFNDSPGRCEHGLSGVL
jgi:hypothetical protein